MYDSFRITLLFVLIYDYNEWVSGCLLNANSGIFQLYHGENKLISNDMMMINVRFVLYQHAELDLYNASSCSDIVYFREMERWRKYVMTPPFFVMWSKEYFKISWGWKQIYLVWMMVNSKLRQAFNRCYAYLSLQRWNFLSSMEPLPDPFNNNIRGVMSTRLFAILILEELMIFTA